MLLTTGVTAASGVGAYAITPSGLSSTNYTISFVPGTLAVTPAPLTVRAENTAKIYGAVLPVFTARYEGLVLGETPGVLAGTPCVHDGRDGHQSRRPLRRHALRAGVHELRHHVR